jgi:hypothetical protein
MIKWPVSNSSAILLPVKKDVSPVEGRMIAWMKRSVGERARVRISRISLGIGTRAADSGVVAG